MAKDLTAALAALTEQASGSSSREDRSLPPAAAPTLVTQRVGRPSSKSATGGAGIAGPLIESNYPARTWWPDRTLLSTDGLFAWTYKPLKSVTMVDGKNNEFIMQFAEPT